MNGLPVALRPGRIGDRRVDEILVPGLELVDAVDRARRIVLEVFEDLGERRARQDAFADLAHRFLDAVELLPAPLVRVVQVELDAVERAREQ